MNLQEFNFLILTTQGRVRTMGCMSLDAAQKADLARTGLFFHNNLIKCIGCRIAADTVDARRIKRHTYSDGCVAAGNALLATEGLRKQSFSSFKWARRQFAAQPRVIDMLSRRGFYVFGRRARLRCAGCKAVAPAASVDAAQRAHAAACAFRHVVDVDVSDCAAAQILRADLPPPRPRPSAPAAPESAASECKVCFANEKSVCFLPCRHLVVCAVCSPRCKRCCVCNAKIASRITTLPQ